MLAQEDWCSLPDYEKGPRLSSGLMFRPPFFLLQASTSGEQIFSGGPLVGTKRHCLCFRATHPVRLFRGLITCSSSLPIGPLESSPSIFSMSKSGRFLTVSNRPPESRPLLRAGDGYRGSPGSELTISDPHPLPPFIPALSPHWMVGNTPHTHTHTHTHTHP